MKHRCQSDTFLALPKLVECLRLFLAKGLCAGGVFFSLWSVVTAYRVLVVTVVFLAVAVVCRYQNVKERFVSAWTFVNRHPVGCLVVVLTCGIGLRLWLVWLYGGGLLDSSNLVSDWKNIWQAVEKFSLGIWCENKSWMTVLTYGMFQRMFEGDLIAAFVLTTFIHLLSAILAYGIGKLISDGATGVCCAFFVFASPLMGVMSLAVMTEHCFLLSVLACLYALMVSERAQCLCRVASCGMAAVAIGFFAMWSRGEGILLLGIAVCVLAMKISRVRGCLKWLLLGLFTVEILFGVGWAFRINVATSGEATVFCSGDNLWPRLFGCNRETRGRYSWKDKRLIFERYKHDHPSCDWDREIYRGRFPMALYGRCPRELTPYVKEEISKRWSDLGMVGALRLVCEKEKIWRDDCTCVGRMFPRLTGQCTKMAFALLPGFALIGIFVFSVSSIMRNSSNLPFVLKVMLSFLLADVVLLALTEVAPRYTFLLHVTGPFFVSWGVSRFYQIVGGKSLKD